MSSRLPLAAHDFIPRAGLEIRLVAKYTGQMPRRNDPSNLSQESDQPIENRKSDRLSRNSDAVEKHNFLVLVSYQILMRTGWIFKTESIIMPAVLDSLANYGWLRGCLPMLNRFGQSVPPMLFSQRLTVMRWKKKALTFCALGMSTTFLALASLWLAPQFLTRWWTPLLFLFFYAAFFAFNGMNQISFGTIQGKLVRINRRGRLMLVSNLMGVGSAVTCASLLMPKWLNSSDANILFLFGFAGICFGASAIAATRLRESPDNHEGSPTSLASHFVASWDILRSDRSFRRTSLVAMSFGVSLLLFPHYQALGRDELGLETHNLVRWVVVQNLGTACFSLVAGPVADRFGNRLVLRLAFLGLLCSPVVALALATIGESASDWYWTVFVTVGISPVAIRTLNNYTLEISAAEDHPRYLSTLSLCMAMPIYLSPMVGWTVDLLGFQPLFWGVAVLVFLGWLVTWGLSEPRKRAEHADASPDVPEA